MLGKIAGAFIGNRLAGRNDGLKGALLGAAGARLAAGRPGPPGTAPPLGWGANKPHQWNKARKAGATYPASATPTGTTRTNSL